MNALSRRLRACGLMLFAPVLLSGCHKQRVVYQTSTPPAPPLEHRAQTRTSPRPTPTPSRTDAPRAPETDAQPTGRPVSVEIGLASWYGPPYHNRRGADGTVFDENALTAAHRTLPMGTVVRVTNLVTNQSVIARITDRGPFVAGRTLDLSLAAAKAIGVYRMGVAKVKVEAFAKTTADPAGRWCVQVGVFIDPADARQTRNDLERRFTTAKVIEFAGPTGHWVRINPTPPDRAAAEHIANSIHLPDSDAYIIRLN